MSSRASLLVGASLGLALAVPVPATAAILDFEVGGSGSCFDAICTDVQGFDFDFTAFGWGVSDNGNTFFNRNGKSIDEGLVGARGLRSGTTSIVMTKSDGGTFRVGALDAAAGLASFAGSLDVELVGALAVGGTVTTTLTATSAWDSYTLTGFDDLTSLTFNHVATGNGFNLDNINTTPLPVPEPVGFDLIDFEVGDPGSCYDPVCGGIDGYEFSFNGFGWGISDDENAFFNRTGRGVDEGLAGTRGQRNGADASITMRREDAEVFSVHELDAAASLQGFVGATTIDLLGTFADGSTISRTLSASVDWDNYILNGFTGLSMLTFTAGNNNAGLNIDNLLVSLGAGNPSQVPAPSTFPALGAGLALLWLGRTRRGRQ